MSILVALALLASMLPGFHGRQITPARMHQLVAQYNDWPIERMTADFLCESRGYIGAISPTEDLGLTQIHVDSWNEFNRLWLIVSPQYAIYAGHEVWQQQGTDAWTCDRLLWGGEDKLVSQ